MIKSPKVSDNEESPNKIQDPIVEHRDFNTNFTYKDNMIPGPPTEFRPIFKEIREAPTRLPLSSISATRNYVLNLLETIYGDQVSPRNNSRIHYDTSLYIEAFMVEEASQDGN